jgi:hypothetical protein
MAFRCAVASLAREEPVPGSASTVRSFLLVENAGPWGVDALRDARLPDEVKDGLRALAARAGVRVLLVRKHRGRLSGPGLRVFAAYAHPESPWMETTTVAGPEGLLDLDLDALGRGRSPGLTPTAESVLCVCTNGRHDACCAELGRPTAVALAAAHPEETWEISHIGGDRFAANVLVLPAGLYYGRVSAADAPGLAAAHLAGHLDLDRLRGRSGFGFAVQVAEVAVRRELGETRTDAVRLVSSTRSEQDTTVRLEVGGASYDVLVRRSQPEDRHQLTCRAAHPNAAPSYQVVSLARTGPGPGTVPGAGPTTG